MCKSTLPLKINNLQAQRLKFNHVKESVMRFKRISISGDGVMVDGKMTSLGFKHFTHRTVVFYRASGRVVKMPQETYSFKDEEQCAKFEKDLFDTVIKPNGAVRAGRRREKPNEPARLRSVNLPDRVVDFYEVCGDDNISKGMRAVVDALTEGHLALTKDTPKDIKAAVEHFKKQRLTATDK